MKYSYETEEMTPLDIMETQDEQYEEIPEDYLYDEEEASEEEMELSEQAHETDASGDDDYLPQHGLAVHNRLQHDPKPTQERLRDIMRRYHSDDEETRKQAMTDMIGILDPYILNLLNTTYSTYVKNGHIEDMMSHGYEGVLNGMKAYDPDRGMPTTWFSRYINHEIQKYINTQINHSTPHYTAAMKKVTECIDRKKKNNIPYTIGDIYRETGVPLKTIKACMQIKEHQQVSISALPKDMDIPSEFGNPERQAEQNEITTLIHNLVFGEPDENGVRVNKILNQEEQLCIMYGYGLDGEKPRSFVDIERLTGIPKYRAPKIMEAARRKLKEELSRRNRAKLAKRIRNSIETEARLSGDMLTIDEMESDIEAVARYQEMGLFN